MKGSLKSIKKQEQPYKRTNFNDWNDPKYKYLKRIKKAKKKSMSVEELETEKKLGQSTSLQKALNIEELRQKIRSGCPLLSKKELRKIKLPFYQSLLINLREDGYIATYQFIKDLIDIDDEWHVDMEGNVQVKNRPFLKQSSETLELLSTGLVKAELAKMEGHAIGEARHLLEMAIQLSDSNNEAWHWLAEEMFEQCISISPSETADRQIEAIAKHIYAEFLLDKKHDPMLAKQYVEESMALSQGKCWTASEITGEKCDNLYFQSGLLIHKIFLEMACQQKCYNIDNAIYSCRLSLQWAKQISDKYAESTALMNLAQLYMGSNRLSSVLPYIDNYIKLCTELGDIQNLCEGYILKAIYHEKVINFKLAIANVQELLKIAEKNKIMEIVALAHHKLATFYLVTGNEAEMLYHATKAYIHYADLKCGFNIQEVKCLTAIALAREIKTDYLDIVLAAGSVDSDELDILLLWKGLHIPFCSNENLFQPEVAENIKLFESIESLKNQAFSKRRNTRQVRMASLMSLVTQNMSKMDSPTLLTLYQHDSKSV